LHASELTLTHPDSREPVTIHCKTPNDFEVALKYLRKFPGARRANEQTGATENLGGSRLIFEERARDAGPWTPDAARETQ